MPRLLLPRVLIACAFVLAGASFAHAADATPTPSLITATDLLKLKQLEGPVLSPDGKWVVYVVRSIEPKADAKEDWSYQTNLWLAPIDGSAAPRQLTRGNSATAPAWSPQGDRIAFVRTVDGKPQIHVLPLAGGESFALTKIDTGATSPKWSPDGSRILFTSSLNFAQVRDALGKAGLPAAPRWPHERPARVANDTGNYGLKKNAAQDTSSADRKAAAKKPDSDAPSSATQPKADGSLQERREWLARNEADGNPRPLHRLNFLNEFDLNPELTFTHLFVQEAREGAEARNLTLDFESYANAEWMPDGKRIVCTRPAGPEEHPDRRLSAQLFLVDATNGGATEFLTLPGHALSNSTPSPDGRWIAFTAVQDSFPTYHQVAVGVVAATGGEPRMLTSQQDRSASNLQWSADSRTIHYVVADRGRFPLFRVALDGSAPQEVTTQPQWGIRDYAIGASALVQIVTHPGNPAELHTTSLDGKSSRPLSSHNSDWIKDRRLSAIEEHSFTNEKGHVVQYWTLKPTALEAGKKYPLLLQIHGGPAAMWGPGEESMWFEFQYYAARGFAVVFANPRGSSGYGREFQAANYRDWGKGPADDVLRATTEATKQSFVDADRLVITGGSYGGYLTAWVIAHDQRFKAAVAQRGVYDLLTFFGEGNAWRLVPLAWGGYPWEPGLREILLQQSPLTHVANIKTPLLIQHGDADRRTGFVQSEMLLKSLKVMGREVESVRYPRATHEMSRSGEPKQRLDSLVRYEEFFRRYVGGE